MNKRLKAIRIFLKLTQPEIASKIGVSAGYYSAMENGKRNISSAVFATLQKLGVNLHWITTGQGEMFVANPDLPESLDPSGDLTETIKTLIELPKDKKERLYRLYQQQKNAAKSIKESNEIHARLKTIRKTLNLKQYTFAAKIGIPANSYSAIERGQNGLTATTLLALDKIGVNLHWLITGQGEMFLTNSEIPLFQEKELNGKKHPILKEFQEIADIKNRFKLVRKTLELSQKDLGKKLGISENFVSAIEYGNKTVHPKIFPHLIELNVNLNWLLFGKGEMFTDGKKTLVNIADPTGTLSEAVKLLSALPEEKQIECIGYIKDKKLLLELQEKLRKDATF